MSHVTRTDFHEIAHACPDFKRSRPRSFYSRVNLKQWRMFHAVVHCGSFANAAEYLHVSQPTISYTISKLESQLGVPLFKLEGRKARLTEQGQKLLEKAKTLLQGAVELEEYAESLRKTWRPEIRLATEHDFPRGLLLNALRSFSELESSGRVTLIEGSTGEVEKVVSSGGADIAISSHIPAGCKGNLLLEVEHVAVANPRYYLFALDRKLTTADLSDAIRIERRENGRAANSLPGTGQVWYLNSFGSVANALCEGFGYGWVPKHRVQNALDDGRLSILSISDSPPYKSLFYLVARESPSSPPETTLLGEILQSHAGRSGVNMVQHGWT